MQALGREDPCSAPWTRSLLARLVLGLAVIASLLAASACLAHGLNGPPTILEIATRPSLRDLVVPQPARARPLRVVARRVAAAAAATAPRPRLPLPSRRRAPDGTWSLVPPLRLLDAVLPVRAARPDPHGDGLVLPMQYSDPDAGYVVRLALGNDNVLVVVDNGSFYLGVATRTCLQERLCSAQDAGYDPRSTGTFLGKKGDLQYASLRIQSDLVRDRLALRALAPDAPCPADGPPPLERDDGLVEVHVQDLVIHAATSMEGTHSNVLGLMDPAAHAGSGGDPKEDPCFLAQVLDPLGLPRRYAVACGEDGRGYLVLGAPPRGCALHGRDARAVPLSREFRYLGAVVLDVDAVLVDGRRLPRGHVRHMVVDTGTSDSYWPPRAGDALLAAGLPATDQPVAAADVDRLPTVEIHVRGGLVLRYGPQRYMRYARGGSSTAVSSFRMDDASVEAIFGAKPVLLLGVSQMLGLTWDFDLERRVCLVSPFGEPPARGVL